MAKNFILILKNFKKKYIDIKGYDDSNYSAASILKFLQLCGAIDLNKYIADQSDLINYKQVVGQTLILVTQNKNNYANCC